MPKRDDTKTDVDPNVIHSPQQDPTSVGVSPEVYQLLAQANLLRIRGSWQEAVDKCMAAMRMSPGNVAVQSLLGDIYENQGNLDDAIRWYRLALDSNPSSLSDRQKLNRLLALRGQTIRDGAEVTLYAGDPGASPLPAAKALRLAAFVFSFLILAIIVAAMQSRTVLRPGPEPAQPALVSSDPVVIGSVPGADPTAVGGPEIGRDSFEGSLRDSLRIATSDMAPSVQFADVLADPRAGRLTLTFVLRPNGALDRPHLLRMAMRAAQDSSLPQDTVTYPNFTVRLLVSPDDLTTTPAGGALVFIGDITRTDIIAPSQDPSSITDQQLVLAFSNEWWSSTIPPESE
ncbi:MAG: tetratricopeptide repeat protein [Capsulimonadaceae bacterium]